MLGTLLAIVVYGALTLGVIDVLLYVVVKIKERHKKRIEQNKQNILLKENEKNNVPS